MFQEGWNGKSLAENHPAEQVVSLPLVCAVLFVRMEGACVYFREMRMCLSSGVCVSLCLCLCSVYVICVSMCVCAHLCTGLFLCLSLRVYVHVLCFDNVYGRCRRCGGGGI